MAIYINQELENFVNAKVSSGMYNSANEVIREALRLLDEQDMIRQMRIKKLNEEIQIGLDEAARGEFISAEELDAHIAERRKNFLKKHSN